MTRQEFMAKMAYNLTRHSLEYPEVYGIDTYEVFVETVIDIADGEPDHPLADTLVDDAGSWADLRNHADDFRDNLGVVGFILDHLAEFDNETMSRIVEGL